MTTAFRRQNPQPPFIVDARQVSAGTNLVSITSKEL